MGGVHSAGRAGILRGTDDPAAVEAGTVGSGYRLAIQLLGVASDGPFAVGPGGPGARELLPLVSALVAIASIGLVDGTTGGSASMSALYMAVVLATAWLRRWRTAVVVAVAGSFVGFAANHPAVVGEPGVAPASLYWNWATRLVVQLGIVYVVGSLQEARREIRDLYGLLRMCAWCRRIHSDEEGWLPVESFLSRKTDATFTHGICPDCFRDTNGSGGRRGRV